MTRVSQCDRILEALREGPVTTAFFLDTYPRIANYKGRIHDLRKRGCVIKSTRLSESMWEYELLSEPGSVIWDLKDTAVKVVRKTEARLSDMRPRFGHAFCKSHGSHPLHQPCPKCQLEKHGVTNA